MFLRSSYTATSTDTLTSVAVKFNVTLAKLKQLNRLYDSSACYEGLELIVPTRTELTTRSAPVPSPTHPSPLLELDELLPSLRTQFARQYVRETPPSSPAPGGEGSGEVATGAHGAHGGGGESTDGYWRQKVQAYHPAPTTAASASAAASSRLSPLDAMQRGLVPPGSHHVAGFVSTTQLVKKDPSEEVGSFDARFLVKDRPVPGTLTISPHQIVFEPAAVSTEIGLLGMLRCQFSCFSSEVKTASVSRFDEEQLEERGLTKSPVIPNTRYLEVVVGKGRGGKVVRAFFLVWREEGGELDTMLSRYLPYAFTCDPEEWSDSEVVDLDQDLLPALHGHSAILSQGHVRQILSFLPPMYRLRDWELLFTTRSHGVSMQTFFNQTVDVSPSLLLVETTDDVIFGAFVSEPWQKSTRFYGTGEAFLFSLSPTAKRYAWTEANHYFMYSTDSLIAVGAGGGKFGLTLSAGFQQGQSDTCPTFNNPPLHLSAVATGEEGEGGGGGGGVSGDSFEVSYFEVWGLGS